MSILARAKTCFRELLFETDIFYVIIHVLSHMLYDIVACVIYIIVFVSPMFFIQCSFSRNAFRYCVNQYSASAVTSDASIGRIVVKASQFNLHIRCLLACPLVFTP